MLRPPLEEVRNCRSARVVQQEVGPQSMSHNVMALFLDRSSVLLRKVKDLRILIPQRNRVKEKWVRYQQTNR